MVQQQGVFSLAVLSPQTPSCSKHPDRLLHCHLRTCLAFYPGTTGTRPAEHPLDNGSSASIVVLTSESCSIDFTFHIPMAIMRPHYKLSCGYTTFSFSPWDYEISANTAISNRPCPLPLFTPLDPVRYPLTSSSYIAHFLVLSCNLLATSIFPLPLLPRPMTKRIDGYSVQWKSRNKRCQHYPMQQYLIKILNKV
ncbi:hypothetical protein CPB86DRAFT_311413 [Serendipita vermifera]|nr:hypothetical protein CPB86DRAFT_311413 [Serendipita vermifera]